jgi:uncharacterized protein (TIGR03083 family)
MKLAPRYDGPPIISSDGPPGDQRAVVARQRRRLETTLAALGADEWSTPSRCDGWSVQDVVAHVVGVNTFWHASVVAGLAGAPTRILSGFDPAATPPLMVEPMRALSSSEVLDQFVASNDAFLGAIADLDDAEWSVLAEAPPGHISIRLLAHHALWDGWVHERDITLPLGSTAVPEPDEVASCLRYAAALGPAFAINAGAPITGVFSVEASNPDVRFRLEVGDAVALREGADSGDAPCLRGDAVELVEALSLRAPLPPAVPVEWSRLLGGLATVFDAELELT